MRVLLADDHKVVRQGTRLYLENRGVEVVGEATNGLEAVTLARALLPDVVVMDIHMPELTGVEATRRIRHELENVRVIMLTAYSDASYVHALLDAGADGFVLKTADLNELYTAIQDVCSGHTVFSDDLMDKANHYGETIGVGESLTERELNVLQYVARGLTNKQIGTILFISDRTVQGHLQNVYQKLHVVTRTEAVTEAVSRGLISLNEGDRRL